VLLFEFFPAVLAVIVLVVGIVLFSINRRAHNNPHDQEASRSPSQPPVSPENATDAATEQKLEWIRAAAGPRFEALELHVRVHLAAVTDDRDTMADALGPAFGLTPEQAVRSPHALAGTVDQIADDLVERRERWGISYIGVGLDSLHELAPVVARMAGT